MTIGQVSEPSYMKRARVKKHLIVLSDGELITVEARGREWLNRINPRGFAPVFDWFTFFDMFWHDPLAQLKSAIEGDRP